MRLKPMMNIENENMAQAAVQRILKNLKYPNVVLSLSHSDYLVSLGGTEKVLHEEQAEFEKREISYVQLHAWAARDEPWWKGYPDQLVGVNVDSTSVGHYGMIQLALILRWLQSSQEACVVACHVHHLMNFSPSGVAHLLGTLQVPRIRVFLHDYYTICPQFNLLREGREYCGADCHDCGTEERRTPHFSMMKRFFKDLEAEFVAPSQIAGDIWGKAFPEHAEKVRVVPHQNGSERRISFSRSGITSPGYRPRIAYLGYESVNKGIEAWRGLVSSPDLKKKYAFYHLGAAGIRLSGVKYVAVSFLEEGPDAMVKALQKNRIDIALLWSIWPETYSFTVFEAFAANAFVLTNEVSGNIAAQVRESGRGMVFGSEGALFHLLQDASGLKALLEEHFKRSRAIDLSFNGRLAEESAKDKRPRSFFAHAGPSERDGLRQESAEWGRLMGAVELETARAEQMEEMTKRILSLEKTLSGLNPQASQGDLQSKEEYVSLPAERPSQQMIDETVRYLRRHPRLKHLTTTLLNTLWRCALKAKKMREG